MIRRSVARCAPEPGGALKFTPFACSWATAVPLSGAGSADRAIDAMAWRTVWAFNSAANVAMPSAAPTWRTVVLIPLATPALSGSMSERITFVSCEPAKPTPTPNSAQPGSNARNDISGETANATNASPVASNTRPVRTTVVTFMYRVSHAPIGAPIAISTPMGSIHTPVRSAERCCPSCSNTGSTNSSANCPIARTVVVSNPYRKPRCRN